MKHLKFVCLCLLCCWGLPMQVLADVPGSVVMQVLALEPKADLLNSQAAEGDLDRDGKADLVILLRVPTAEYGHTNALLVFLYQGKDAYGLHSYRLAGQSQSWLAHSRRHEEISLYKGYLSLAMNGAGSCCTYYHDQATFAWRQAKLVLLDYEAAYSGTEQEFQAEFDTHRQINFVTGKIQLQAANYTKKGRREIRKEIRFTPRPLLDLAHFSLDLIFDLLNEDPELGQYLDQHWQLIVPHTAVSPKNE